MSRFLLSGLIHGKTDGQIIATLASQFEKDGVTIRNNDKELIELQKRLQRAETELADHQEWSKLQDDNNNWKQSWRDFDCFKAWQDAKYNPPVSTGESLQAGEITLVTKEEAASMPYPQDPTSHYVKE